MLSGKAIVITGAGNGIGAACAAGIANQGASVVVNDIDADAARRTSERIAAAGGTARACIADVSDWDDAGRLIAFCIDAYGRIDGLVNNAALYHIGSATEFNPKVARALVEVNVLGTMHCTGHAIGPMLAQGSGSIVNLVSGAQMGMPGMGIYGATKGAIASLIYTWALELAGSGVRMNGLSPFGATNILGNSNRVLNNRYDAGVEDEPPPRGVSEIQAPEDNSPVVEYLLSDEAAYVNGQLVRIDKGELQLYTHPALLLPSLWRETWDARGVAEAFATEFKHRLVRCGVLGMEALPVDLSSGYWRRVDQPGSN